LALRDKISWTPLEVKWAFCKHSLKILLNRR
jgi:hypothetical protein